MIYDLLFLILYLLYLLYDINLLIMYSICIKYTD